jgi:hypothetical protein
VSQNLALMAQISVQDERICFPSQREESTIADSERMCNDSQVVWFPRSCDIVLGRGAGLLKHAGNVKFRERIGAHQDKYNSSNRHRLKQQVARRVRQVNRQTGARFLCSIKTEKETRRLGLLTAIKAWYITSEDVAMTKIKQALREWQQSEKRRGASCAVPKAKGYSKHISERNTEPLRLPSLPLRLHRRVPPSNYS